MAKAKKEQKKEEKKEKEEKKPQAEVKKGNGKQPSIKCKGGIFSFAAWIKKHVIGVPDEQDGYGVEREFTRIYSCFSLGATKNIKVVKNEGWTNVYVWITESQVDNLIEVATDFKRQISKFREKKALRGGLE